jgi:hypothetical protein
VVRQLSALGLRLVNGALQNLDDFLLGVGHSCTHFGWETR